MITLSYIKYYISLNWSSSLKYYFAIASILFVNSLHIIFFTNDEMYDVYFFYDHKRYFTNILYDIGIIYSSNILTYILIKYKRLIFLPIFYTTLAMWVTYFLFYHQLASLILIPFYTCIAIVLQLKARKK